MKLTLQHKIVILNFGIIVLMTAWVATLLTHHATIAWASFVGAWAFALIAKQMDKRADAEERAASYERLYNLVRNGHVCAEEYIQALETYQVGWQSVDVKPKKKGVYFVITDQYKEGDIMAASYFDNQWHCDHGQVEQWHSLPPYPRKNK